MNRILVDLGSTMRMYTRSPSAIFWTLAFPLLLIILFGAIFSGTGDASYDLYVQDLDDSDMSRQLIESLDSTNVLDIKQVPADEGADAYIEERSLSSFLLIPADLSETVASGGSAALDLRLDQSTQSSQVVYNVVSSVVQQTNLQVAGANESVSMDVGNIIREDYDFLDFFLPGVIGLTVMTSALPLIHI